MNDGVVQTVSNLNFGVSLSAASSQRTRSETIRTYFTFDYRQLLCSKLADMLTIFFDGLLRDISAHVEAKHNDTHT